MPFGLNTQQLRALAAGFISMLIYGSSYTYGTIMPYILSYIYYYGDDTITSNQMAVLLPVSIIVLNFGMPINNIPQLQFSNKINTLISVIGVCASVCVMSFGNQLWHVMLFYGIFYGLFIGYGYMAPIKNCYEHIPDRKGLCSGVCILGYGIASLLFNMILQQLINPDNQKLIPLEDGRRVYSVQVADNVPFTLRIMSFVYVCIGIVGILLMKPPVEKKDLLVDDQEQKNSTISKEDEIPIIAQNQNEKEGVGSYILRKKIHLLTLTLSCSVPFGMFIAFNYKEYGSIKIDNDSFLTAVGSCGAIFNGFGRLVFGMLFDKFSFKIISTVINVILLIFSLTLPLLIEVKFLYIIAVSCIYFVYGGNYSIYPTQTVRVFGSKIGAKVYYLVFFGFSFACLIQYFSRKILVPQDDKQNGFRTCFFIFAGFNAIALLLGWFVNYDYVQQPKEEAKNPPKQID